MNIKELVLQVREVGIQYDQGDPVLCQKLLDSFEKEERLNGSEKAFKLVKNYFKLFSDEKERVLAIPLDTHLRPIGLDLVSIGNLNTSIISPREVFRKAILAGAHGLILAHNHPSGDTKPSMEDINSTRRLHECGKILGIDLLDHIIYGDGSEEVTSLKQEGIF